MSKAVWVNGRYVLFEGMTEEQKTMPEATKSKIRAEVNAILLSNKQIQSEHSD